METEVLIFLQGLSRLQDLQPFQVEDILKPTGINTPAIRRMFTGFYMIYYFLMKNLIKAKT